MLCSKWNGTYAFPKICLKFEVNCTVNIFCRKFEEIQQIQSWIASERACIYEHCNTFNISINTVLSTKILFSFMTQQLHTFWLPTLKKFLVQVNQHFQIQLIMISYLYQLNGTCRVKVNTYSFCVISIGSYNLFCYVNRMLINQLFLGSRTRKNIQISCY